LDRTVEVGRTRYRRGAPKKFEFEGEKKVYLNPSGEKNHHTEMWTAAKSGRVKRAPREKDKSREHLARKLRSSISSESSMQGVLERDQYPGGKPGQDWKERE